MWLSKLLYVLLGTALLALTSCERGGSGGWDPAPQEDASESSDGAWSADTEAPPNTALDQGAGAGADAGPDATDSSVALGPQPDAQQPSGGGGSDATDYGFDAGPQGPACADYCALHAHCTRDNALYASESDCLMQCGAWARWPAGLEGDSENTIACRLAQLEAIAEGGSPDEHCSAAGPTGGDVCGSWCDNYCALALANCTGTHTLYSGEVDCQIACSNIPEDGEHYAVEGDSVQCRIRQLMLAGSDRGGPAPGQYCPAASLSGAPPCGRASGIGCGEAVLVDELPFVAEADNTDVGSSFHLEAGACDGFFFARGQMGSDHAYVLTAEQTGVYTITLEASFDTLLYVATSCPDVSPSCVEYSDSWGDEEIDLEAQAGQTYYIIVDTDAETPTEGGPYRLTVEEPCIPSCDGRICGHDGCDGSCGECGLGKVCSDEGTCVDPNTVPGNTCANPHVVDSFPYQAERDTSGASNTVEFSSGSCPGESGGAGSASSDHLYRVDPTEDGVYTVTVEAGFDAVLYAFEDCSRVDATCLAAVDDYANEQIKVRMTPPGPYFVAVDGWSSYSNVAGRYRLEVSAPCVPDCGEGACGPDGCGHVCGRCSAGDLCDEGSCVEAESIEGNTCASAFEIGELPFETSGDTTEGATGVYRTESGRCPDDSAAVGGASRDHVYRLSAPSTGVYDIEIDADYDVSVYVLGGCSGSHGTCLSLGEDGYGEETAQVRLEEGETVHVVVDGFSNSTDQAGTYTLSIPEPCVPECDGKECGPDGCNLHCGNCEPGDLCSEEGLCQEASSIAGNTCVSAFEVDEIPYSADGDTDDGTNVYFTRDGLCPGHDKGVGAGSPEQVYSFTPEISGTYEIGVDARFDAVIYVVENCRNINSTCLILGEDGYGQESVKVAMTATETYFVIVDGFSNTTGSSGSYSLEIAEPCVPQCEGKPCGPDGCGTSCGTCPAPDRCEPESGQCLPPAPTPGNSCATAFEVDALPYEVSGDSIDAENVLTAPKGSCPELYTAKGDASREHVYSFTPEHDGVYRFELESIFDAALYVIEDCSQVAKTCIGASDRADKEVIELELLAGYTFFVVVDGYSNANDLYGEYTLKISEIVAEGEETGGDPTE